MGHSIAEMKTIRMSCLTGLFGLMLATLPAEGESLPRFNEQAMEQWWQEHPGPEEWAKGREVLLEQLRSAYESKPTSAFVSGSDFSEWFTLALFLKLVPAGGWDESKNARFRQLGKNIESIRIIIDNIHPKDDRRKVMEILFSLMEARPEAFPAYLKLAMAYAIVFDRDFPRNWPHHQVAREAVPIGNQSVVERFQYYYQLNEENELEYDLRTDLGVQDIKFIVDSLVSLDELTWGREESDQKASRLERAFSFIQYETIRAQQSVYRWPHGDYLLKNIVERGGICVDQAYFAYICGKAMGIPTLYFSGQGSGGGHAWFGFMERRGKWNLDVGRYASQNYPVGEARDPQVWERINDAELNFIAGDIRGQDNYWPARLEFFWARENRDAPWYADVLDEAIRKMPLLIEPWYVKAAYLEKKKNAQEELKELYLDWIRIFDDIADYKVDGQKRLLAIYEQEEHPDTEYLRKEIVRENRRKRFDIGIASGAAPVLEKIDNDDWEGAEKEFKRMVRKFDEQGGGNLFYKLIRPYVRTCLEEEKYENADTALDYVDSRMAISQDSIIGKELARLRELLEKAEEQVSDSGQGEI
jgi:hypothetical protein